MRVSRGRRIGHDRAGRSRPRGTCGPKLVPRDSGWSETLVRRLPNSPGLGLEAMATLSNRGTPFVDRPIRQGGTSQSAHLHAITDKHLPARRIIVNGSDFGLRYNAWSERAALLFAGSLNLALDLAVSLNTGHDRIRRGRLRRRGVGGSLDPVEHSAELGV